MEDSIKELIQNVIQNYSNLSKCIELTKNFKEEILLKNQQNYAQNICINLSKFFRKQYQVNLTVQIKQIDNNSFLENLYKQRSNT